MLYNALSYCNCIYLHFYLCNAVNIALLNAQSSSDITLYIPDVFVL